MPHIAPPSPLLTSYFAILHGQAKQHPLSQSPGVFRFFFVFFVTVGPGGKQASAGISKLDPKLRRNLGGKPTPKMNVLLVDCVG